MSETDVILQEPEKYSIMLVDDDLDEREGVKFLIEKAKLPLLILEAPNGKRAYEMLLERHADILFTDIKMPYMDGLELANEINKLHPSTKIIIFSAYGEFEYAKKAMIANAVNYLLKPVDVDEFYNVLNSVIKQCQKEKELASQRNRQISSDIKLQWINALTGKLPSIDTKILRKYFNTDFPDSPIILFHIEMQGEQIWKYEPEILKCLSKYISSKYEYINIYPDSSYVILFCELEHDELNEIACSIISELRTYDETFTILISKAEESVRFLNRQYKLVNSLRNQILVCETPVIFADNFIPQVDKQMDKVVEQNGEPSTVIQKAVSIIYDEYDKDLSLDYLASRVGLAPSYLSFVFKKEKGENIVKFITDYRMEKAAQLLSGGTEKVINIARKCGYDNPSYFNRLFKNTYGMTPKQYREKRYEA